MDAIAIADVSLLYADGTLIAYFNRWYGLPGVQVRARELKSDNLFSPFPAAQSSFSLYRKASCNLQEVEVFPTISLHSEVMRFRR